jgi:hypothetical protein
MSGSDKAKGMKSAYELALERLEAQGIERPREEALSDETKREIAEARRQTEAKLAELEILHRDKLRKLDDATKLAEQDEFYRLEKDRIERDGEARVAKLRG